jgi:hypothetical protein
MMMKRTTIAVVAAALGVAVLAAVPALAQDPEPGPEVTCPYHDSAVMPHDDMADGMGSAQHHDWMASTDHSAMHSSMSAHQEMLGEGNMMGSGNMMGGDGMMGGSPGR